MTERRRNLSLLGLAASAVLVTAGCGGSASTPVPGGNSHRGAALISEIGCGACHTIAGIDNASGEVGPNLSGFAQRRVIAGRLSNTPQNLIRWIENPQAIDPGNIMPNLGVSPQAARDIAAYLDHS
ncbi:MAG TPA: c-type cytochrome [Gaiellaceae bacterium]|nr:c-type cytochrome [Gaiellaceae bacterium]